MYRGSVSALLLATALGGLGCSSDKSGTPNGGDDPAYSELIVGEWEWVCVIDSGEVDYMDEDQLFWVFTAEGNYCDPERRDDSTYYVLCHGSYEISPVMLTIDCPSGTHLELEYRFSPEGDTLRCGRISVLEVVMKRVHDPPDYGGCN
jgi:hypothetical protein